MKSFNQLRQLARSYKWQIIYSKCKELSGLELFNNKSDLSAIQLAFLQWLEIYHSLEMDLAMKEKCISREVINDDYRTDAYLLHKSNKDNKETKAPPPGYEAPLDVPSIRFK